MDRYTKSKHIMHTEMTGHTHTHTSLGQRQNRAAATDIPTSQVAH